VPSSWFYYKEICHDAWSHERKKKKKLNSSNSLFVTHKPKISELIIYADTEVNRANGEVTRVSSKAVVNYRITYLGK
jgi:hypothetical protein